MGDQALVVVLAGGDGGAVEGGAVESSPPVAVGVVDLVRDHHVIVARGREYGDVTPLRGVYAGGGKSSQQVEVRITREA